MIGAAMRMLLILLVACGTGGCVEGCGPCNGASVTKSYAVGFPDGGDTGCAPDGGCECECVAKCKEEATVECDWVIFCERINADPDAGTHSVSCQLGQAICG
jgi:hypothetical protein